MPSVSIRVKNLVLTSILISLALVLSFIEKSLFIFIPIAGFKLGIANIVSMFALYFLGVRYALLIVILRVLISSLLGGGITSLLFGLIGGILSCLCMYLLSKIPDKYISIHGISIAGAAMHNIGQTLAAIIILKNIYVIGYLPFLLVISIPLGFITSIIFAYIWKYTNSLRITKRD